MDDRSSTLGIWLDSHCTRGDMTVFRSVASLQKETGDVESVGSGAELVSCIRGYRHLDHIVIAGHGGPTWLLDDAYGVTTDEPENTLQVHVSDMASAIVHALHDRGLVSIAACMCSRSPTWFLKWRIGKYIGSDWGPRAYLPGGEASLSARVRDYAWWFGKTIRVRGHRAAGHASALALLAEHDGDDGVGTPCATLYKRALPFVLPDLAMRQWWVRTVTGDLAQRWLLGDDSVVKIIKDQWVKDQWVADNA